MPSSSSRDEQVEKVAKAADERDLQIATAESLTCGAIASALGAGPNASSWLAGGIVAYSVQVKQKVLGVPEGPVVTAACAEQMARGALEATGADVAVSATGVGGPDPEEGEPPGTTYLAVATTSMAPQTRELRLDGDPEEVLRQTVDHALEMLAEVLDQA
jgi:nicotinamide-nucleotide amidase